MRDPAPGGRPIGLILAGGHARRLGGGDKTRLTVGGRPMLARIVERLAPQCAALLVSANGDAGRWADAGLTVVPDHHVDAGAGPLAGLLAGLDRVAGAYPECRFVLTAPADTPFLPADLAGRLGAAAATAHARSGDRDHPLVAMWPVAARDRLRRAMRDEAMRRASEACRRFGSVAVTWSVEPLDPFLNVNTPEDLARAERIAALADAHPSGRE